MAQERINLERILDQVVDRVEAGRYFKPEYERPQFDELHRRAAVLSTFNVESIGASSPDDEAVIPLLNHSSPTFIQGEQQWVLNQDIRRSVLGQIGSSGNLMEIINSIPQRPNDSLQQALIKMLSGKIELESSSLEELVALQNVSGWFRTLPQDVKLPDIEGRIRWLNLLRPFKNLAGENFQDRKDLLDELSDYVGVLGATSNLEALRRGFRRLFSIKEEPPLMIHGPGGMGKSALLARFILNHVEQFESGRLPFAYIDFDRARISAEKPSTLLYEAVFQLEAQYPESAHQFSGLRNAWMDLSDDNFRSLVKTQRYSPEGARGASAELHERMVGDFAKSMYLVFNERPFLLFLDTFEKVHFSTEQARTNFWMMLDRLQGEYPYLRLVISGRAEVGDDPDAKLQTSREFDLRTRKKKIEGLPENAARDYLVNAGFDPELAAIVARRVAPRGEGASPLSLRVAVGVWRRRQERGAMDVLDEAYWAELQAGRIQEQLINRYLDHLDDENLQKIVNPGFVLHSITPELIAEVLSGPCNVSFSHPGEEIELFEKLRLAVDLVTITGPDSDEVFPRSEVRKEILSLMKELEPSKVNEIHGAAVTYYAVKSDAAEGESRAQLRAEEIYHRLMRGDPEDIVRQRWGIEGVAGYMADGDDELNARGLALLLSLRGGQIPQSLQEAASLESWETSTARQVSQTSDAGRRLELLSERSERTPGSELYALGAQAFLDTGQWEEALRVADEGLVTYSSSANSANRIDLLMVRSRIPMTAGKLDGVQPLLDEAWSLALDREDPRRLLSIAMIEHELAELMGSQDLLVKSRRDMSQSIGYMSTEALRSNVSLVAQAIVRIGPGRPEVILAGIQGGVLERTDDRQRRDLGRAMANFDRGVSRSLGQPDGFVGLKSGLPFRGTANDAWQQLFIDLTTLAPTIVIEALKRFGTEHAQEFFDAVIGTLSSASDTTTFGQGGPSTSSGNWWARRRISSGNLFNISQSFADAFEPEEFRNLLLYGLSRTPEAITSTSLPHLQVVLNVVRAANSENWLDELLLSGRFNRPGSGAILRQSNAQESGALLYREKQLERLARSTGSGISLYESNLSRLAFKVCRVEVRGEPRGTGFLVGPDLIMTASSVLSEDMVPALDEVRFRFSYASDRFGHVLHEGVNYSSDAGPVLDSEGYLEGGRISTGELGYAVVRISSHAGDEPTGDREISERTRERRGWVELPTPGARKDSSPGLIILHHPPSSPLRATFDEQQVNSESPGLEFRLGPIEGSAGAPIFSTDFLLMGIHQGRNRRTAFGTSAQAISLSMSEKGTLGNLGQALT